MSGRYLRGTDQRPFVVSIISGASAKFFNLGFQKCHISPPKTTLQQLTNWRENDMIYCTRRKDDIRIYRERQGYIRIYRYRDDIGYKSTAMMLKPTVTKRY